MPTEIDNSPTSPTPNPQLPTTILLSLAKEPYSLTTLTMTLHLSDQIPKISCPSKHLVNTRQASEQEIPCIILHTSRLYHKGRPIANTRPILVIRHRGLTLTIISLHKMSHHF